MTASSPLAVGLLGGLGLARVVVPRELSIEEIRAYAAGSTIPLEVFIHGALCVAWSGQCLSSEAWGGRSANRGQCAQACRLPYRLVVDGDERDLGEVEYLLSPKDLAGLDAVPALAEIGVASLKIEGRLKGPHYVATTVAQYRAAAATAVGEPTPAPRIELPLPLDPASLHVAYSRGISPGLPRRRGPPDAWSRAGSRATAACRSARSSRSIATRSTWSPRRISDRSPAGTRSPDRARRAPTASPPIIPRAGMGVVFDRGRPEEPSKAGRSSRSTASPMATGCGSARPAPICPRSAPGDFVWISSDPRVTRAGDKAAEAGRGPLGRIAVALDGARRRRHRRSR